LPSVAQYSAMPLGSAYGTPGPPFEYKYAAPDGGDPWSAIITHSVTQSVYMLHTPLKPGILKHSQTALSLQVEPCLIKLKSSQIRMPLCY